MTKTGIEFKTRKWTDRIDKPQFDVVALDYDNNKQHYHPDAAVVFSTIELADKFSNSLNSRNNDTACMNFVRDHWPVDGGIE